MADYNEESLSSRAQDVLNGIIALEQELRQCAADKRDFEKQLAEEQAQHQQIQSALADSQAQHEATARDLEQRMTELSELREAHQALGQQLAEEQAQHQQTQATLNDSRAQHEATACNLEQRTKDLVELQEAQHLLEQQLAEEQTQHQQTQTILADSRAQHESVVGDLDRCRVESYHLKRKIEDLNRSRINDIKSLLVGDQFSLLDRLDDLIAEQRKHTDVDALENGIKALSIKLRNQIGAMLGAIERFPEGDQIDLQCADNLELEQHLEQYNWSGHTPFADGARKRSFAVHRQGWAIVTEDNDRVILRRARLIPIPEESASPSEPMETANAEALQPEPDQTQDDRRGHKSRRKSKKQGR
jgi:hypothetical protein